MEFTLTNVCKPKHVHVHDGYDAHEMLEHSVNVTVFSSSLGRIQSLSWDTTVELIFCT